MNNNFLGASAIDSQDSSHLKTFMASVFSWMFLALLITSCVSVWFASDSSLMQLLITEEGKRTMLGYIVMFAPLAFVFGMSFAFNKLSFPMLVLFFMLYAGTFGMSLSFIFLIYNLGSIATIFLSAALMFGVMAIVGYTTKTDLTSFGRIMMMGLVGILVASLINMFLRSPGFSYIISSIGVLVFTGLTAYDVQKIKEIGMGNTYGEQEKKKLAVMSALTLFLDFINLFLMLLNLFGSRK